METEVVTNGHAKMMKMPKITVEEQKIKIPPLAFALANITLIGDTPLLVNKFSEKSKVEMLEKQMKRAKAAKPARDPEAEVQAALYVIESKSTKKAKFYGIPAGGLKNCCVSACRFISGVPMTIARGAFQIISDNPENLIEIKGSKPVIDERIVRIGGFKKTAMVRFRPRFDEWSLSFKVKYNQSIISPEQLLNLFENAGFAVGLCEHRPEKNGNNGMFSVKRS